MRIDKPSRIAKSKTFWTGVATIAGAGAAYATGGLASGEAVQLALNGLIAIFMRMAIEKNGAPPPAP